MKKNLFLMTLLSTALMSAAPLTASAAELKVSSVSSGNCYTVYVGQGFDCLPQTLKDICSEIISGCTTGGNSGSTDKPNVTVPPASDAPSAGESGGDIPNTEVSDTDTLSYAEQIAELVNAERAKAGLSAVTLSEDISAAADVRAVEIKQSFSHTRPDGSSFSSVLSQFNVSYRGSGENIAWGQKSPEEVMNAWMNSDGHRANILNVNFKNIGIGHYQDTNGINYWVQLFTY
ncbi:MAG: CAP domain-containing protein [Lachnospiraceae bacterium]|nr:CAP domain-containing protein [Lachnospiraceae bacterium]